MLLDFEKHFYPFFVLNIFIIRWELEKTDGLNWRKFSSFSLFTGDKIDVLCWEESGIYLSLQGHNLCKGFKLIGYVIVEI